MTKWGQVYKSKKRNQNTYWNVVLGPGPSNFSKNDCLTILGCAKGLGFDPNLKSKFSQTNTGFFFFDIFLKFSIKIIHGYRKWILSGPSEQPNLYMVLVADRRTSRNFCEMSTVVFFPPEIFTWFFSAENFSKRDQRMNTVRFPFGPQIKFIQWNLNSTV